MPPPIYNRRVSEMEGYKYTAEIKLNGIYQQVDCMKDEIKSMREEIMELVPLKEKVKEQENELKNVALVLGVLSVSEHIKLFLRKYDATAFYKKGSLLKTLGATKKDIWRMRMFTSLRNVIAHPPIFEKFVCEDEDMNRWARAIQEDESLRWPIKK